MMSDKNTGPLTPGNFESVLSSYDLSKGEDYFKNGAVGRLTGGDGSWRAVVTGTKDYQVKIELSGGTFVSYSCNCPHNAVFCKHIVATFFALKASLPDLVKSAAPAQPAPISPARAQFVKAVLEIIGDASYGTGFIEYEYGPRFTKDINRLLDQAEAAFRNQQYTKVSDIAFAIIIELHKILESEARGFIQAGIENGFELFQRLLAVKLPADLRKRILEEIGREAKNPEYAGYGYEEEWEKINLLDRS